MPKAKYTFNPACRCEWCINQGTAPKGTALNGHSFGYGNPHHPPSVSPWAKRA